MAMASVIAIIGIILYILGFLGLGMFIIVLFKLNKVLDIWLEEHRRKLP